MAKRKDTRAGFRDAGIDALYAGDLGGFTARRNELAKRLANDGDGEGAKAVRGLRKPSKVAWAANQVSHREPELRDRLLEAGAALRDVQERRLSGKASADEARQASDLERDVVGDLVTAAQELAESEGSPLSQIAVERTRRTLHAVARDQDVRGQFERGILTVEHEAVGLGPVSMASGPGTKTAGPKKAKAAQDDKKRRREALKAAADALEKAESEAAAAGGRTEELREQL